MIRSPRSLQGRLLVMVLSMVVAVWLVAAALTWFDARHELDELLGSLTRQQHRDFEVIVVEDGSTKTARDIVEKYRPQLDVQYFFIENVGQGFARNYGFTKAKGDYLIVFDSDTIIPPHYLATVDEQLSREFLDGFIQDVLSDFYPIDGG